MNLLGNKRNFVSSKLKFKSKNKISPIIYKEREHREVNTNNYENESVIPLQEENKEKTIFKEFVSENDLKKGLNPQKTYSKLSKIEPLPKEYKVYKKNKLTNFEKKHLKKLEKDKNSDLVKKNNIKDEKMNPYIKSEANLDINEKN